MHGNDLKCSKYCKHKLLTCYCWLRNLAIPGQMRAEQMTQQFDTPRGSWGCRETRAAPENTGCRPLKVITLYMWTIPMPPTVNIAVALVAIDAVRAVASSCAHQPPVATHGLAGHSQALDGKPKVTELVFDAEHSELGNIQCGTLCCSRSRAVRKQSLARAARPASYLGFLGRALRHRQF